MDRVLSEEKQRDHNSQWITPKQLADWTELLMDDLAETGVQSEFIANLNDIVEDHVSESDDLVHAINRSMMDINDGGAYLKMLCRRAVEEYVRDNDAEVADYFGDMVEGK